MVIYRDLSFNQPYYFMFIYRLIRLLYYLPMERMINLARAFDDEILIEKIEQLEKENDKLKIHIEAKDKAYMDLLTDYNYLKARIKRMEKAYLKFNKDFKKIDDELDNAIMNR